jgi:hypothetical protein
MARDFNRAISHEVGKALKAAIIMYGTRFAPRATIVAAELGVFEPKPSNAPIIGQPTLDRPSEAGFQLRNLVPLALPAVAMGVGRFFGPAEALPLVCEEPGLVASAVGPKASQDLAERIASLAEGPSWTRAVAVLETAEGPTIVGGGATDLNAAQKALARELGLTVAPDFPEIHAEGTVLNGAGQLGLTPTVGVVTNHVCSGICAPMIQEMGGWVDGRWFGFGER